MKRALRWIGFALGAVATFVIALFFERKAGEDEGKAEAAAAEKVTKVEEAGKRGDTGPIDDAWRGK